MDRILIIGVDSIAGTAVAEQLAPRSDVTGLWLTRPVFFPGCSSSRMEENSLAEKCQDADVIVFCGGAARSSWDAQFGEFDAEQQWLRACTTAAAESETRFIFISSDAVFGGPWVFHDDDSCSYSDTKIGQQLRSFESCVQSVAGSLIVRTNIVGVDADRCSFIARILERIDTGECEHVDAHIHATPLAASEFSEVLAECIGANTVGLLNVGGAERTTPFRFATLLAAGIGCGEEHFMPSDNGGRKAQEQSLRCERLRHELKMPAPMLKETVERVAQVFSETAEQAAA